MPDNGSVLPSAAVRLQLDGKIFARVEDWRRSQLKIPSRSRAVRLLIERALAARPDGPRPPERQRPHASSRRTTQKFEAAPTTSPT